MLFSSALISCACVHRINNIKTRTLKGIPYCLTRSLGKYYCWYLVEFLRTRVEQAWRLQKRKRKHVALCRIIREVSENRFIDYSAILGMANSKYSIWPLIYITFLLTVVGNERDFQCFLSRSNIFASGTSRTQSWRCFFCSFRCRLVESLQYYSQGDLYPVMTNAFNALRDTRISVLALLLLILWCRKFSIRTGFGLGRVKF